VYTAVDLWIRGFFTEWTHLDDRRTYYTAFVMWCVHILNMGFHFFFFFFFFFFRIWLTKVNY
jgi:hypothetical protein